MKQSAELVFVPSPGIGHLVSTMEVAKLLLSRNDQLFITVLIMKFPFSSDPIDAYIDSFADSSICHRIKFINLTQQNLETQGNSTINFFRFIDNQQTYVRNVVAKLIESETKTRLAGLVIDMFCASMIDVANELGVSTYLFFTSSAASLGLQFHLQTLRDDHKLNCMEFKDSTTADVVIPSYANPLPAAGVLPSGLFEKEANKQFLNMAKRYRDVKGILINTFSELESHAILSLSSDDKIPPVYPVGPVLNLKSDEKNDQVDSYQSKQKSEILKWLDDQPQSSVVFLCFGSMGSFGEDQVNEIACALEHGGFRFLWSLRQPPLEGKILASDYADYTGVLPEGFLDRTAGVGKVLGWAPQVAILAHPAVGGFVTHCGWNSILESLWFGVPVATWPLFGEQQLNAFQLVKELGIAVEIDMSYRKDGSVILSAQKIESGIKEVMVMQVDSQVRKKVKQMSDFSKKALMDGGSSYNSLGQFIDQI